MNAKFTTPHLLGLTVEEKFFWHLKKMAVRDKTTVSEMCRNILEKETFYDGWRLSVEKFPLKRKVCDAKTLEDIIGSGK